MKRLIALLALTTAFGVAACDGPSSNEPEVADASMDAPVAPTAEDVAVPAAAPSAVDTPPDSTTMPSEKRTSEESVKPESETLFY